MLQRKMNILFPGTGNSCRSRMTRGWARHLKHDTVEPSSAGREEHGLNRPAVDDPPRLAAGADDPEGASRHYRRLRAEIRASVETLPGSLPPRRPADG